MVLSRFWLIIFVCSIIFIISGLFTQKYYSIDYVLNGKQGESLLIGEQYLNEIPQYVQDSINASVSKEYVLNNTTSDADTTYVYNKQTVKIYSGKQQSDGLLPMAKSSLLDLILPLIAYLAFFCGIMELLIHDKKNVGGRVNFVLLTDFEQFKFDCKVEKELLIEALDYYSA
jgi:hypothetical protein